MDLEKWAARNDALIGPKAARAAGLSNAAAKHRAATGRYVRLRRGVYGINGAPPSWRQVVRAVILAHPGVAGSHDTAIRLLGGWLENPSDQIHVSGPLNDRCRLEGVVAHRSMTFEAGDRTERFGIPCTSPVRTVIDLSGTLSMTELGRVVDDLLRRKQLSLEQLRERVARTRPAPGRSAARLRKVLAARIPGYDPGESDLESRIIAVLAKAGLPLPTLQHRVKLGRDKYRIDLSWPAARVYLEGNSFGWHRLSSDLESDARRQNNLVIDHWRPIEITWHMSDHEIASTVRAVLQP